jgi:hypothetical protein
MLTPLQQHQRASTHKPIVGPRPVGNWYSGPVLFWAVKRGFFHGVDKDVVDAQKKRDLLSGDVDRMHAGAAHYDNKVLPFR